MATLSSRPWYFLPVRRDLIKLFLRGLFGVRLEKLHSGDRWPCGMGSLGEYRAASISVSAFWVPRFCGHVGNLTHSMTDQLSLRELLIGSSLSNQPCWSGRVSQSALSKAVNLTNTAYTDGLWVRQSWFNQLRPRHQDWFPYEDHSSNFIVGRTSFQKRGCRHGTNLVLHEHFSLSFSKMFYVVEPNTSNLHRKY